MTNAWSLYNELKMTENFETNYKSSIPNQDFWEEDGISMTGNPCNLSPDVITFGNTSISGSTGTDYINFDEYPCAAHSGFGGTHLPGGMGDDHISFIGYPYSSYIVNMDTTPNLTNNSPAIPWKYNEDKIVKELLEYVRGTYNQHYSAGDDKIQTLDLIEACGDGEAFCRSNILKYASRYDKKGTSRRDIMKILHYAVLLMNFNDKNAKREVYSQ